LQGWNYSSSAYSTYPKYGWQTYWHWRDSSITTVDKPAFLTMGISENNGTYTVTCTYASSVNIWIPSGFSRTTKSYSLNFTPSWSSNLYVILPYLP